jgi:amidase
MNSPSGIGSEDEKVTGDFFDDSTLHESVFAYFLQEDDDDPDAGLQQGTLDWVNNTEIFTTTAAFTFQEAGINAYFSPGLYLMEAFSVPALECWVPIITGNAGCENFCFSGGSHTSDCNPVYNPANPKYTSGGSSSGSGAVVASGAVDMALGGDQGGSIRIPSGWCGIVGLKPTHGLVPYTGIFPIESTLDHTGPMTKNVSDAALLLEVIAGEDGLDPRQVHVRTSAYTEALTGDISGLRVAVLKEGFGWEGDSEEVVDNAVRVAIRALGELGADVKEASVPMHRDGIHLWNAIAVEGATAQMVKGDGFGFNWRGHYSLTLRDFYGRARRARPNDFPRGVKLVALLGQYMSDRYNGHYYAKAQNLSRTLRARYDAVLADADVLVMPTLPMRAMEIPENPDLATFMRSALGMLHNTCPYDITGHPAITVPCGESDGLPIGMMLVGKHFDENSILRAAHAYEKHGQ